MAGYDLPPRQKMINLIYIILLAMLAVNVSTDVMKGYSILKDAYKEQNEQLQENNDWILKELEFLQNDSLSEKALRLEERTTELLDFLDGLKEQIARQADKEDYVIGELKKEDDLKAVPYIMLAPTQGNGKKLRAKLDFLREELLVGMRDSSAKMLVAKYLNTIPAKNKLGTSFSWEKEAFSSLPAIGGIVLLNKTREGVLLSVNEGLKDLLAQAKEIEENTGGKPDIDEQRVAVSARMMNILYAGFDNPLDLFAGEVSVNELYVETDNGVVRREQGSWYVRPKRVSKTTVTVSRTVGGKTKVLGTFVFKVKTMPEPIPFLTYRATDGKKFVYKGGVPIKKECLLGVESLNASLADGDLNIPFLVVQFETVFVGTDKSIENIQNSGNKFSSKLLERIKNIKKGDKFYITSIIVRGQDGLKRQIEPLEVVVI